jgi:hypothetical protein
VDEKLGFVGSIVSTLRARSSCLHYFLIMENQKAVLSDSIKYIKATPTTEEHLIFRFLFAV